MKYLLARLIVPLLTITAIILVSFWGCSDKTSSPEDNLPQITSLSANTVRPGDTLSIYGENFGNKTGIVFFDSITGSIVNWSDSLITVGIPENMRNCEITINTGGHVSNSLPLYLAVPQILSITPTSIAPGGQIAIAGIMFGGARKIVLVDTESAAIVNWSNTLITCIVPNDASEGNIQVITAAQASNIRRIFIGTAKIESVSPQIVSRGSTITITGEYFGATTGQITFSNLAANITSWSDSLIRFTVPITATGGAIEVKTDYGAIRNAEVELKVLQVFSIAPDCGEGGDTVIVRGEFYGADWLGVYFNAFEAEIIDRSDTVITAIVPDITVSADVMVNTDYESSQPLPFEYFHLSEMLEFINRTNSVDVSVSCLSKNVYCENYGYSMDWECDTTGWHYGTTNVSSTNWHEQYIEWQGNQFNLDYEYFTEYYEIWNVHLLITGQVDSNLDSLINISAVFRSGNGTAHHYSSSSSSAYAHNVPISVINQADTVVIFHLSGVSLEPSQVARGQTSSSEDMDTDYYKSGIIENDPTSAEFPPEVTIKFYRRD